MQSIAEIQERIRANLKNPQALALSYEESLQRRVDSYNAGEGDLPLYDCAICKNKGHIAVVMDGYEAMKECKCMDIRRGIQRIEKSGLSETLRECTFDNYIANDEWQRKIKAFAERFTEEQNPAWFYIGGQVGAGKTHICTAIVGKFLNAGKAAHYMLWRDESVRLKATVNNDEEYDKAITPLKTVDVLYIDDFFKTERGKSPTTADINLAFEILNYRYNNRNLITIISSERSMDELVDIDEAVGSRIYQRAKGYGLHISHSRDKNYRLS